MQPEELKEYEKQTTAADQSIMVPPIFRLPKDVITLILDPEVRLEKIRIDLLGAKWSEVSKDDNGRPIFAFVVPKDKKGDMNERGVEEVMSILKFYISPETSLSNMDDNEIRNIVRALHKLLNSLFYENWQEFGMVENRISLITTKIVDNVFMQLKKSKNKALLDALTKAYTVKEFHDGSQKERKGLDISLNPFKK